MRWLKIVLYKKQQVITPRSSRLLDYTNELVNWAHYKQLNLSVYLSQRIAVHRLEVSPGVKVCLVKTITAEVKPDELADALTKSINIQVSPTPTHR